MAIEMIKNASHIRDNAQIVDYCINIETQYHKMAYYTLKTASLLIINVNKLITLF